MGRKKSKVHGKRAARADWELQTNFAELHDAAIAFADEGDFDRLVIALDALESDPRAFEYPVFDATAPRDERLFTLARQYVNLSQFISRMRGVIAEIEINRDEVKTGLIVTVAEPKGTPVYMQTLVERMQAEGLGQPDVHPPSRALARHLVEQVHSFNRNRRHHLENGPAEDYSDEPINDWSELPREFHGYELVDMEEEPLDPCPLPPSTDISYFTTSGERPPCSASKSDTYQAWADEVIAPWCERNKRELPYNHRFTWALLLAHWIEDDGPPIKYFKGKELQSPWDQQKYVRVEFMPA